MIGIEIVAGRIPDARLAWRTGARPAVLFVVALGLSLTVPLQYAILAAAVLSLVDFVASAGNRARFLLCTRDDQGWIVSLGDPSETVPSAAILTMSYEGPNFFAEVPVLIDATPKPLADGDPSVVVLNISLLSDLSSTFLKALAKYQNDLAAAGCGLVLCGVSEKTRETLAATGLLTQLGAENVLDLDLHIGANLDAGSERAQLLLEDLGR